MFKKRKAAKNLDVTENLSTDTEYFSSDIFNDSRIIDRIKQFGEDTIWNIFENSADTIADIILERGLLGEDRDSDMVIPLAVYDILLDIAYNGKYDIPLSIDRYAHDIGMPEFMERTDIEMTINAIEDFIFLDVLPVESHSIFDDFVERTVREGGYYFVDALDKQHRLHQGDKDVGVSLASSAISYFCKARLLDSIYGGRFDSEEIWEDAFNHAEKQFPTKLERELNIYHRLSNGPKTLVHVENISIGESAHIEIPLEGLEWFGKKQYEGWFVDNLREIPGYLRGSIHQNFRVREIDSDGSVGREIVLFSVALDYSYNRSSEYDFSTVIK